MAKTTKKLSRRRVFVIMLALLLTAGLSGGLISAYYSDYFQSNGTLTTNTLKINVEQTVTLNGTATTLDSITKIIPGDVIVISGTVTGTGAEPAWVRETIKLTPTDSPIVPYIEVYNMAISQEDLLNDVDYSENLVVATDGVMSTAPMVLGGVGEVPNYGDNIFLGTSYTYSYTIYFSKLATNDTQNQTINISLTTQALQFNNNSASIPSEAAWASVA